MYGLKHCPFCIKAQQMLEMHNTPHKTVWVADNEKEKYKKLNKMSTFPQLFYKPLRSKKRVKLGGSDDLEKLYLVARVINQQDLDMRAINFINKNM